MKIFYPKIYVVLLCLTFMLSTTSCSKDDADDVLNETETLIAPENNSNTSEEPTENTPETPEVPDNTTENNTDTTTETPEPENTNNQPVANTGLNAVEQEILRLVNEHRQSINKQPVAVNALANTLADDHTNYMISIGAINHDNFDQRSNRLFQEENARSTAENVALGQRSAQAVMEAWLKSPGHRRNIEGDFTHIGISALNNSSGRPYYTQLFLKK